MSWILVRGCVLDFSEGLCPGCWCKGCVLDVGVRGVSWMLV